MSLSFRGELDLLEYLTATAPGRGLLREAIVGSPEIVQEILTYNKTGYVAALVYRCGWVEILSSPHIRAKILFLGRKDTFPEREIAVQDRVREILKPPYHNLATRKVGLRDCGLESDRTIRGTPDELDRWRAETARFHVENYLRGQGIDLEAEDGPENYNV